MERPMKSTMPERIKSSLGHIAEVVLEGQAQEGPEVRKGQEKVRYELDVVPRAKKIRLHKSIRKA